MLLILLGFGAVVFGSDDEASPSPIKRVQITSPKAKTAPETLGSALAQKLAATKLELAATKAKVSRREEALAASRDNLVETYRGYKNLVLTVRASYAQAVTEGSLTQNDVDDMVKEDEEYCEALKKAAKIDD